MEYLVQGCTRQLRPNEFGHTHCNLVLHERKRNGDRLERKIELYRCDNAQIIEYAYPAFAENRVADYLDYYNLDDLR